MRTFKEIFTTTFAENAINRDKLPADFVHALVDSYKLGQLKIFLPAPMSKRLIRISYSKNNPGEILFGFDSHHACTEFNKYHASRMLGTIRSADIKEKLGLRDCDSVRGYAFREYLKLYDVVEVSPRDLVERAHGTFINHAKNPKVYEIFERIREIIISRRKQIAALRTQQIDSKPTSYHIGSRTFPKENIENKTKK